jgi:hypothetical protein
MMKYVIIFCIAIGGMLSLAVGIKYTCEGSEMFPTHYASPFVFKQKSLGTSMQYYYSVAGLILNVVLWSFVLALIHKGIHHMLCTVIKKKFITMSYNVLIGVLLAFSTLTIAIDLMMLGRGFNKQSNYWYWNSNQEANAWGVTCSGEFIFFQDSY